MFLWWILAALAIWDLSVILIRKKVFRQFNFSLFLPNINFVDVGVSWFTKKFIFTQPLFFQKSFELHNRAIYSGKNQNKQVINFTWIFHEWSYSKLVNLTIFLINWLTRLKKSSNELWKTKDFSYISIEDIWIVLRKQSISRYLNIKTFQNLIIL